MDKLSSPGKAHTVIPMDTLFVKPPETAESIKERKARMRKRLPSGKMSRSYYLITTDKHLVKRIRPIEDKKLENHEFRNSLTTPERKFLCDWCDQTYLGNPLHRF